MSKVVSTVMWKAMGIIFKKTNKQKQYERRKIITLCHQQTKRSYG